jgi:hypothetical protein
MRVFFWTLRVLISQLLYDIAMYFYDFSAVLWETRRNILKRMVFFVAIIVTLLFDIWIFIVWYDWFVHPLMVTLLIICMGLGVTAQIEIFLRGKDIYKWFLNEWSRASNTYRHKRAEIQLAKMHNDQVSAVGKALDACRDSKDLNKTINDRISW